MPEKKGFGTFLGVFVPNVTMMFGVILFMRLGLIVGNVGLFEYLSIIAISIVFMVITALSIAMIVTNMQVGSGGAYFLISRSVGIEMGGALGIGLILSQIISAAVCTSGFAYSLNFLLPDVPVLAIEFVTLLALALISFVSADLALKSQFLITDGAQTRYFSGESSAAHGSTSGRCLLYVQQSAPSTRFA